MDTIVKKGVRFLNKVGSFAMMDNTTNTVAFTGEFGTVYAIEITGTTQDTRGGAGNALLMQTHGDRNVAITLTLKEWNLEYIAAATGGKISWENMSEVFKIEEPVNLDDTGKVKLTPAPIGKVSVRLPDGRRTTVIPDAAGVIDVSDLIKDECVSVTYAYNTGAKVVNISADKSPFVGKLVLDGKISDNLVGDAGIVQVVIPAFACSDNLTITMNADGTTSDTVISGVALATNGEKCLDGMQYGFVKEVLNNSVAPTVTEIIASPSPVELEAAGTQMITVLGSISPMYAPIGIANTECTFATAAPAVATVSTGGVITGVATGDAVITVTYNEKLTDTIDVSVA